ncbi:uncharacterized protein METZ01_LOCUS278002, partial [marine metagenome]
LKAGKEIAAKRIEDRLMKFVNLAMVNHR